VSYVVWRDGWKLGRALGSVLRQLPGALRQSPR
jgi:hypothetical protein